MIFELREIHISLRELEAAVEQLPAEDLNTFAEWFQGYLANEWDRRIEADIHAGRLDEAFENGECRPL